STKRQSGGGVTADIAAGESAATNSTVARPQTARPASKAAFLIPHDPFVGVPPSRRSSPERRETRRILEALRQRADGPRRTSRGGEAREEPKRDGDPNRRRHAQESALLDRGPVPRPKRGDAGSG